MNLKYWIIEPLIQTINMLNVILIIKIDHVWTNSSNFIIYLFVISKTPGKSAEILIIKAMKKVITSVNDILSTNVHKYGGSGLYNTIYS